MRSFPYSLLALASALPLVPASGQYRSCIQENTTPRDVISFQQPGDYSWMIKTPSKDITINTIWLPTAGISVNNVLKTAVYAADGSGRPMGSPLRTGFLSTSSGVFTTFPALFVPANTRLCWTWTLPEGKVESVSYSIARSGTPILHWYRFPNQTTWIHTNDYALIYIVDCEANCGSTGYLSEGDWCEWDSLKMGNSASAAHLVRNDYGGNPNAFVNAHTYPKSGSTNEGNALLAIWRSSNVWTPSTQGAIRSLTLTIDFKTYSCPVSRGQGLSPLVIQDGSYYIAYVSPGDNTGRSLDAWKTLTRGPKYEGDFYRVWPVNTARHPDFSPLGKPITLGFLVWSTDPSGSYTADHYYDNFQMTVDLVGAGSVTFYGSACSGLQGLPIFTAIGPPKIGKTLGLELSSVATDDAAMLLLGLSRSTWGSLPLPIELTMLRSPGCWLRVSADLTIYTGPPARVTLGIPNEKGLVGEHVFFQWLAYEPRNVVKPFLATQGADVMLGM